MSKSDQLANLLKQMAAHCDTGFALAIHIRYTRPSLLFQTYEEEWNSYYSRNGLMLSDPVVVWGLQNTGLVVWDSLADVDEAKVLVAARDHGLRNGITYATGSPSSRTITGWTKSGDPFTQAELDDLVRIANEIHELTEGIENFGEAELQSLRELDPTEY